MKTVFIQFDKIQSILVNDKQINNSYEYIPPFKHFLGGIFNKNYGHWVEHDWYETDYIGVNLPDNVINEYLVENYKVYYKPFVRITLKSSYHDKKFNSYQEAYNFAKEINTKKEDFELIID